MAALLVAGLSGGLIGCAGLPAKPVVVRAEGDVHLTGRLSIQVSSSTARPTGGNVGFDLSGNPAAGQLELSTPLGSLVARATWGAGEVKLQTPEGERQFTDLDELSRELLGEAIPVAALFDWLQGRPWPQMSSRPLAQEQAGFEQLGWRIDLSGFDAAGKQGVITAAKGANAGANANSSEPIVTLRARVEPSSATP
ncbi:MAG: outer membrane lipoprotein LolB [Burkholderiaceae bacterium]|nr:outer membrane lipoprotein LolB [Burkholderiaceae bacterium]